MRLAREKDLEGLKAVRRRSRVISYANLALMVVILVLAVMLRDAALSGSVRSFKDITDQERFKNTITFALIQFSQLLY